MKIPSAGIVSPAFALELTTVKVTGSAIPYPSGASISSNLYRCPSIKLQPLTVSSECLISTIPFSLVVKTSGILFFLASNAVRSLLSVTSKSWNFAPFNAAFVFASRFTSVYANTSAVPPAIDSI